MLIIFCAFSKSFVPRTATFFHKVMVGATSASAVVPLSRQRCSGACVVRAVGLRSHVVVVVPPQVTYGHILSPYGAKFLPIFLMSRGHEVFLMPGQECTHRIHRIRTEYSILKDTRRIH